jgi:hypothetical protein
MIYGMPHGRVFHLHNGISVYMESGKKSPGMPGAWTDVEELPRLGIYEGEYIAELMHTYSGHLFDHEYELWQRSYFLFASAPEYTPKSRARAVNLLLPHIEDDVIYIEPHCNASGNEWSKAQGHIVFHNEAATECAPILSECIDEFKAQDTKNRGVKLAPKSWWLDEVNCPAMYSEIFFMTNKYETEIAMEYLGMEGSFLGFQEFHRRVLK